MRWQAILLTVAALPLSLEGEVLPIRSYTTADGLASDHIDCIVPDSRGFIWFCTPEGLTRFDGYRMVGFGTADGLPHRSVYSFLATRSGAYFAGTDRGLSQLDSRAGGNKFIAHRQAGDGFDRPVYPLRESRSGRIWCGMRGGLFEVLGGGRFRRQPLPGLERTSVTDILEDPGGQLWVATIDGIFVLGKDGAVQHITKKDGLPDNWVNALLWDSAGRLWAGTRGALALLRDGGAGSRSGVQRVYADKDGLAGTNVLALAEGSDGAVWMGTAVGISRLLPGSGDAVFQNLNRGQGLSDREVGALAADQAGNMWAGTVGAGVMRIGSAGFITFREQDGLRTDLVDSVFVDRAGTVVAVTELGIQGGRSVAVLDGAGFHAVVPKVIGDNAGWGQNQILLQSRTGEWWAATHAGLCRFPAVSVAGLADRQPAACYAPGAEVFRVFEDSKGGIWASAQTAQGDRLLRWDPQRNAISSFDDGPNRHQLASAFAEDRSGNVWMGFWGRDGGELLRFDGRQFTRLKFPDGPPATIFALLIDHRGRLWIGSAGAGLAVFDDPGRAPFHPRTYDTMSGLASSLVTALVEDKAGRIYAGTGKGVDRLDPATGRIKHFSAADGLPHGEIRSAARDGAGNLWFATTQGLSRLTPAADRPPKIPSVLITDLETGGRRYPVSQAGAALLRPPKLDPSRNQLQVTFVGFNDEPEESLRYRYKLEGTDQAWHDTSEHTVNYAALEPGGYSFLVQALNSEDQASAVPAEIDFVVLPPLWGRWWFEALALAALASLVWAAHRYRVAQAVNLERMRIRIATDLHDDIGAGLSQIAILSEVLIRRSGGDQGLSGPLSGMAGSARELLASMSDIVWAINPRHDHLRDLQQRMRRFSSDLFGARNIDFVFRAPALDRELKLGADMRREIYLVFKEAVNNIVRHADCTQAEIDFSYERDWLALRVSDNGKGLPEGESGAGHGLLNMQARAKALGGAVSIASAAGQGTAIVLRVPLGRPRAFPWRKPSS
jgi:ligand-binding sensor domain-containing protein/signal transduction histidine kinase